MRKILIGTVGVVGSGFIVLLIMLVLVLSNEVRNLGEQAEDLVEQNRELLVLQQESNCKMMAEDRLLQLAEARAIEIDQDRTTQTLETTQVRLEAKKWTPSTQLERSRRWILSATPVFVISDGRAVRSESQWDLSVMVSEEDLARVGDWNYLSTYCATSR